MPGHLHARRLNNHAWMLGPGGPWCAVPMLVCAGREHGVQQLVIEVRSGQRARRAPHNYTPCPFTSHGASMTTPECLDGELRHAGRGEAGRAMPAPGNAGGVHMG